MIAKPPGQTNRGLGPGPGPDSQAKPEAQTNRGNPLTTPSLLNILALNIGDAT